MGDNTRFVSNIYIWVIILDVNSQHKQDVEISEDKYFSTQEVIYAVVDNIRV